MCSPRTQAGLVQAAGHVLDQARQIRPGQRLPDAVFLLAHGGRRGRAAGMLQQQLGKGCLPWSFKTILKPIDWLEPLSRPAMLGLYLTPCCRLRRQFAGS
jgi:hypothetical protein